MTMICRISILGAVVTALCLTVGAVDREVNFATEVKPILERSCAQCHSGEKPKGGFSVETREALLRGGQSKEAAVTPGHSSASPLVQFVSDLVREMEMPPLEKRKSIPALTQSEIALLRAWIDQGAQWPDGVTLKAAPIMATKNDVHSSAVSAPGHAPLFDMIRVGDRRG